MRDGKSKTRSGFVYDSTLTRRCRAALKTAGLPEAEPVVVGWSTAERGRDEVAVGMVDGDYPLRTCGQSDGRDEFLDACAVVLETTGLRVGRRGALLVVETGDAP